MWKGLVPGRNFPTDYIRNTYLSTLSEGFNYEGFKRFSNPCGVSSLTDLWVDLPAKHMTMEQQRTT